MSQVHTGIKEALVQAVVGALSDMAFLDAIEAQPVAPPFPTSHVISVGFTKPVRGEIALYLPLDCKRTIVENVHGQDWDSLSAAEIDDCLLELGNIVAGNLLNAYCGRGTAHDISLPVLLFDDADLSCPGERADVTFDAEGHPLRALVCLE
jgi:CheY-specific phosphatase CheX